MQGALIPSGKTPRSLAQSRDAWFRSVKHAAADPLETIAAYHGAQDYATHVRMSGEQASLACA